MSVMSARNVKKMDKYKVVIVQGVREALGVKIEFAANELAEMGYAVSKIVPLSAGGTLVLILGEWPKAQLNQRPLTKIDLRRRL